MEVFQERAELINFFNINNVGYKERNFSVETSTTNSSFRDYLLHRSILFLVILSRVCWTFNFDEKLDVSFFSTDVPDLTKLQMVLRLSTQQHFCRASSKKSCLKWPTFLLFFYGKTYRTVTIADVAAVTGHRCWHPQVIAWDSIFRPIWSVSNLTWTRIIARFSVKRR